MLCLKIALKWNQSPEWFYGLDADTKSSLIAEYNLSFLSSEDIAKRKKQATKKRLRRRDV